MINTEICKKETEKEERTTKKINNRCPICGVKGIPYSIPNWNCKGKDWDKEILRCFYCDNIDCPIKVFRAE